MNEDEEIYRLMNEEDGFYMGDKEERGSSRKHSAKKPEPTSGCGCAGVLVALAVLVAFLIIVLL